MMTRRKSVHESTLLAQLQMQERAAEEQLTLGALATGIANILSPSQSSHSSPSGVQSVQALPSASPTSASTSAVPSVSQSPLLKQSPYSCELAKKSSGMSPNEAGTSGGSNNNCSSHGGKHSATGRSKTPRISKRSAPIDVPQSTVGGTIANPSTSAATTNPVGPNVTHGTGTAPSIACGSNPVQQTLAQNGMDPDEIPQFKGYRIIEIDHFLQWSAYSQFMHSKHCPGGLLKPYQEYISGCYSTFAMKCSKCAAIITRSSENYIHHNKLMNRLVKGTVELGKEYDEMQQFMESLEVPFVTREEFNSIRGEVSSSLEDQSSLQRAVEELERASSVSSKRKRHGGSCKYHYEVLKVYLNKKMKKMEETLQHTVNDSVALAVNTHLKHVSHMQLASNGISNTTANCTAMISGGVNGGICRTNSSNSIGNLAIGTINLQSVPMATTTMAAAPTTVTMNGSNGTNNGSNGPSSGGTTMQYSNGSRAGTGPVVAQLVQPESTFGGIVSGRLPPGNREQQH